MNIDGDRPDIPYAGLDLCQDAELPNSTIPAGQEIPALVGGPVQSTPYGTPGTVIR